MKRNDKSLLAAAAAFLITVSPAVAALTFHNGNSGSLYYTNDNSNAIISFDWGSDSNLYFMDSQSYNFGGFHRYDGATKTTLVAGNSNFAGASVVAIGSSIFFNDSNSNYFIHRYDIAGNSLTSTQTENYSLATNGTSLFTTGSADWVITDLKYYPNGTFGQSITLGGVAGSSGPMAFDANGNLYYGVGYGSSEIFRWSASDVATAIATEGGTPLDQTAGFWLDYGSIFGSPEGATAMAFDSAGNLYVTLTAFANSSMLVKFETNGSGNHELILDSDQRLGDIRIVNDILYVADGNQIFSVAVPEPSAFLLTVMGAAAFGLKRRRLNS